jgi:hypothetical protein
MNGLIFMIAEDFVHYVAKILRDHEGSLLGDDSGAAGSSYRVTEPIPPGS